MSVFEKTINAFKDRDIDALENLHHEDFIYVNDYSFSDRADHLAGLKVFIQDTDWHHKTRCVHEDAYTLVMRTERIDENGHVTVSNNVSQIKNGQYYRTMTVSSNLEQRD